MGKTRKDRKDYGDFKDFGKRKKRYKRKKTKKEFVRNAPVEEYLSDPDMLDEDY